MNIKNKTFFPILKLQIFPETKSSDVQREKIEEISTTTQKNKSEINSISNQMRIEVTEVQQENIPIRAQQNINKNVQPLRKDHIHLKSEITEEYENNQDPLVKQKHLAITAGMIPLYAGSTVYVYKADLLKIFHENPKVYTGRLANLLFGSETLKKCSEYKELDRFSYLDTDFLSALISKLNSYLKYYFDNTIMLIVCPPVP